MRTSGLLPICFAFLLTLGCTAQSPYFEGVITYTIATTYKADNPRHKVFYENEKFGDTVRVYTNEAGYTKRTFPGSGRYGSKAYYYDPSSNREMATYNFTDTVYVVDASNTGVIDIRIQPCTSASTESVLGYEVDCLEMISRDTFLDVTMTSRYYYPREGLAINYATWEKNKDFLQGEMYWRSKSHWLRIEADYGNYAYVMQAVSVDPRAVAKEEFVPPSGPEKMLQ